MRACACVALMGVCTRFCVDAALTRARARSHDQVCLAKERHCGSARRSSRPQGKEDRAEAQERRDQRRKLARLGSLRGDFCRLRVFFCSAALVGGRRSLHRRARRRVMPHRCAQRLTKRVASIRQVIREVSGFTPYGELASFCAWLFFLLSSASFAC